MTTAISVPFHGNTLFVVDYDGQPYTPMKPIVEGMGMDWASQFTKLKSNTRWGIVKITIPTSGDMQEAICLPLRKLMGWLMTIHPNKVKPEIRDGIIRYQNECDDALWDYWTKGQSTRQNALKSLESPSLTASEQQTLSEIVDLRARECENQGKAKAEIWSRLHRKFRVAKYSQLQRDKLGDAIAYVMLMEIKATAISASATTYSAPLSLWKPGNKVGDTGWLTYPELTKVETPLRPIAVLLRQLNNDGHDIEGAKAEYSAIKVMLDQFYWRLNTMAEIFERLNHHGLRIIQH